jgi:hypothetical protein
MKLRGLMFTIFAQRFTQRTGVEVFTQRAAEQIHAPKDGGNVLQM